LSSSAAAEWNRGIVDAEGRPEDDDVDGEKAALSRMLTTGLMHWMEPSLLTWPTM
jgi:hypothetical protein